MLADGAALYMMEDADMAHSVSMATPWAEAHSRWTVLSSRVTAWASAHSQDRKALNIVMSCLRSPLRCSTPLSLAQLEVCHQLYMAVSFSNFIEYIPTIPEWDSGLTHFMDVENAGQLVHYRQCLFDTCGEVIIRHKIQAFDTEEQRKQWEAHTRRQVRLKVWQMEKQCFAAHVSSSGQPVLSSHRLHVRPMCGTFADFCALCDLMEDGLARTYFENGKRSFPPWTLRKMQSYLGVGFLVFPRFADPAARLTADHEHPEEAEAAQAIGLVFIRETPGNKKTCTPNSRAAIIVEQHPELAAASYVQQLDPNILLRSHTRGDFLGFEAMVLVMDWAMLRCFKARMMLLRLYVEEQARSYEHQGDQQEAEVGGWRTVLADGQLREWSDRRTSSLRTSDAIEMMSTALSSAAAASSSAACSSDMCEDTLFSDLRALSRGYQRLRELLGPSPSRLTDVWSAHMSLFNFPQQSDVEWLGSLAVCWKVHPDNKHCDSMANRLALQSKRSQEGAETSHPGVMTVEGDAGCPGSAAAASSPRPWVTRPCVPPGPDLLLVRVGETQACKSYPSPRLEYCVDIPFSQCFTSAMRNTVMLQQCETLRTQSGAMGRPSEISPYSLLCHELEDMTVKTGQQPTAQSPLRQASQGSSSLSSSSAASAPASFVPASAGLHQRAPFLHAWPAPESGEYLMDRQHGRG